MKRLLVAIGLVMSLIPVPATAQTEFAPAQIWRLKDNQFPSVQVVIGKLETVEDVLVVHVSVLHVPIDNAGNETNISHMPFSEEALHSSVDEQIVAEDAFVDHFKEGYDAWREAQGGYFTISVSESIKAVLQTANISQPQ